MLRFVSVGAMLVVLGSSIAFAQIARYELPVRATPTPSGLNGAAAAGPVGAAPANDAFATRGTLTGNSAATTASNVEATAETGEPAHAHNTAVKSMWWQWTAAQAGRVQLDTFGSSFDTVLAVYTGTTLATLLPVALNDEAGVGSNSAVSFMANAGMTYLIAVDGWNGASGAITLNLAHTPANLDLYATDFAAFSGGGNALAGREGWSATNLTAATTGTFDSFLMGSRVAYVGLNPTTDSGVLAWRSIGYEPVAGGTKVLRFDVDLVIYDSADFTKRDDFAFVFYNTAGQVLAAIDFYNPNGNIYRYDGTTFHPLRAFTRNTKLTLSVTIDFAQNTWTASLNDSVLFGGQPLNVQGRPRSLGLIAASWSVVNTGAPGNNFMAFDNYRVSVAPSSPVIVAQPVSQSVVAGQAVTFFSAAGGVPSPQYQWLASRDGVFFSSLPESPSFSGTQSSTLRVNPTNVSLDGMQFRMRASNGTNPDAFSAAATLTVASQPTISTHLRTKLALVGQPVSFSVVATGNGALSYQWQHNGQTIAGATSATFSVPAVTLAQRGWYRVAVSDAIGTTTSVARLDVARATGTVAAWGGNEYGGNQHGEATVAAVWTNIVAVAAGYSHSVALTSQGTVLAWGNNGSGETTVPAGLTDVVAIAAGDRQSVALKRDGTVVAWGTPWGPNDAPARFAVVAGLRNIVAIGPGYALRANGTVATWSLSDIMPPEANDLVAVGALPFLALKADRSVISWLGSYQPSLVPAEAADVVDLAVASESIVVLRADGGIVAWRNIGDLSVVPSEKVFAAVAAGQFWGMGLKTDGTVVGWGSNLYGQAAVPDYVVDTTAISAGPRHGLAVIAAVAPSFVLQPESDSVTPGATIDITAQAYGPPPFTYRWKKNGAALSDGGRVSGAASTRLLITNAQASDSGSYVLDVSNAGGLVTSTAATITVAAPPVISSRPLSRIATLGRSVSFTITATDPTSLTYQWHRNRQAISGATAATLSLPAVASTDAGFYEVIVTNAHGGAVRSFLMLDVVSLDFDRTGLVGWGQQPPSTPIFDVVAVASNRHGLALKTDGTVVGWGGGDWSGAATAPAGLREVIAVSAGENYSLAIKADGTVVTWGLGAPTVPNLSRVVGIAGGTSTFAVALRSNGRVAHWGIYSPTPPAVQDFTSIAAGEGGHVVARRLDGSVVAWGSNTFGQTTVPADVTGVLEIDAGNGHSVALRSNGIVVAWGSNSVGESTVPAGLTQVVGIAAGGVHTLALKSDGTIVAWGYNSNGQASVPAGMNNALAVSAGTYSSAAIVGIVAPRVTMPPASRTVALGTSVELSVTATGTAPLSYQWRRQGTSLIGATNATLALNNLTTAEAGNYTVAISNPAGAVVSEAATLVLGTAPFIAAPPLSQTVVIGGTINLGFSVTGTAPLAYQWKRDGTNLLPATNATLTIANAQAADSGGYTVVVSNAFGTIASATATVAVRPPASPSIERQPRNQFASAGSTATFSVGASGLPLPSYQWFKNGEPIEGATAATLTLTNVSAADATNYVVKMTNASGNVTSAVVTLTLVPAGLAATHLVLGPGHFGGGAVTISNRFAYTGLAPGLDWQVLLPAGWSYASTNGADGATKPAAGVTALAEWKWATLPASPVTFSYTLNVPAGATGSAELVALIAVRPTGDPIQLLAIPDPLTVRQVVHHGADTNRDMELSLFELTRVIELYNTRNGTVRTGAYRVDASNLEDGFGADPTRVTAPASALVQYHSADTRGATTGAPRDGMIDLFELTRVIELYNTRAGTVRTGRYHVQEGTEDGFAAGP